MSNRLIGRTSHFDCENIGSSPVSTAMNKELYDRIIKALRGGKYVQGSVYLRDSGLWSVMGVFCDTWGGGTWEGNQYRGPTTLEKSFLPPELVEELGLVDNRGFFYVFDLEHSFKKKLYRFDQGNFSSILRLDNRKVPFPMLASILEQQPKSLFKVLKDEH